MKIYAVFSLPAAEHDRRHITHATRRFSNLYFSLLAFGSLLLLSSSTLAQAPAVTTLKLKSEVLGEERTILVRTPAAYETSTNRYPVVYMTDGDAHIGHTGSTVEFLARNGRMSELIVVGISNTNRLRDLSPTHVKTVNPDGSLQFPNSGGGDKFSNSLKRNSSRTLKSDIAYRLIAYWRAILSAACLRFTRWSRDLSCSTLTSQ